MSIKYVLTDGKGRYIKANFDGSYITIKNLTLAERWSDRNKANNVLKHCLSKAKRKQFHVKEIQEADGGPEHPVKVNNKPVTQEKQSPQASEAPKNSVDMDSICEFVTATKDYVLDCEQRAATLSDQLSQIDKELEDIYHFIEFSSLNACNGYKAYKLCHEKRQERRKIKDELVILSKMGSSKLNEQEMKLLQQEIKSLNTRVYKPRALPELFSKESNQK